MRCIYEICYIPWENNAEGKPWLYSGSDFYDNDLYLGSPSSKQKTSWTNGLTVCQWWRLEKRQYPERFEKRILLKVGDHVTRQELQSLESAIQKKEDHRSSQKYFNRTNKHFNSSHVASSPLQGLSYEEIYGKEKATELKKIRSESFKTIRKEEKERGYKRKYTKPSCFKNKTYEEIYGKEKAVKLKRARSESSKEARKQDGHLLNKRLLESGKHPSQQKIKCENCNKIIDKANYARWHGKNCRG